MGESRRRFDVFVREVDPQMPSGDTVYEYFVDLKAHGWKNWEERVPTSFKPAPDTPFYRLIVPTVDTTRNTYLVQTLVKARRHVMLVGVRVTLIL